MEGKIVTKLSSSISHQGIRLKVNASVNLQVLISHIFCLILPFKIGVEFEVVQSYALAYSMFKVDIQVRGGSAGVIESFYGVIKPITIL